VGPWCPVPQTRSHGTHSKVGARLPADSVCVCTAPLLTATSATSSASDANGLKASLAKPLLDSSAQCSVVSAPNKCDMCARTAAASAVTASMLCADRTAWPRLPPRSPVDVSSAARVEAPTADNRTSWPFCRSCSAAAERCRGAGDCSAKATALPGVGTRVPNFAMVCTGLASRFLVTCWMMLLARHSWVAWSTDAEPPQHRILS